MVVVGTLADVGIRMANNPVNRKINWLGGMDSQTDPAKRAFDEGYWLGVNIRTRANTAASVRAPLDITSGLPSGLPIQGLYTFDRSLLAFVGGGAYYKQNSTLPWLQIAGFAMSPAVAEIDCAPIPSSSVNFIRSATGDTSQESNAVVLGTPLQASPAALIVMDGVTQARLIFPDATTRITNNYLQWTTANPEYVPIARYPTFSGSVLYCVGKDLRGNYTQIFRSVSGQPVNFVILIKKNGDKISTAEAEGGAPALAHRVSYAPVTAMNAANVSVPGLIVSTANGTYAAIPDYERTIAAEPTFSNVTMMDIGAVSKNSIVDVLGDTTIVCRAGVRSFNAVKSVHWEGKNAPFSAAINNFISANEQTVTAAGSFDNYALYALTTRFGPGVVVYDMLQSRWVGIDIYPGVGLIKQFATVQSGTTEELFFYTEDNKVYKAFAGGALTSSVYLNELVPEDAVNVHSISNISASFSDVKLAGYAESYCAVDRVVVPSVSHALPLSGTVQTQPTDIPFNAPTIDDQVITPCFNYTQTKRNGTRAMAGVSWNADAVLLQVDVTTSEVAGALKNLDQVCVATPKLVHVSNDYGVGMNKASVHAAMLKLTDVTAYIGSGNHATSPGADFDIYTSVRPYWDGLKSVGKFYSTPGPNELATPNAIPFYNYLRQGPDRWSKLSFAPSLDVFFLQAGGGAEQTAWLTRECAASTAAYKIVCVGRTVESSVSGVVLEAFDYKSLGISAILTPAGNIYERLVLPDGLTVINNGCGGGVSMPTTLPAPSANSKRMLNVYGYVTVSATPLHLTFTFTNHNTCYVDDTTNL